MDTKLTEIIDFSSAEFIEENGTRVVRNVVMLGPFSSHGYEYEQGAMRQAVSNGLYEDIPIFINHAEGNRDVMKLAGVFQGVRHDGGKVKGDAHLLDDDYGRKFWNIARQTPKAAGCSHVADGKLVTKNGKKVVEEISKVYSVDLVVQGATTKGVFESDTANPPAEKTVSIPRPRPDEKQDAFIRRCIKQVQAEDDTTTDDIALRTCFTVWQKHAESDSAEVTVITLPAPERPAVKANNQPTKEAGHEPAERNIPMSTIDQQMKERDEMLAQAGRILSGRYDDILREEERKEQDRQYEERERERKTNERLLETTACTLHLGGGRESDQEFQRRMNEQAQKKREDERLMKEGMEILNINRPGALVE